MHQRPHPRELKAVGIAVADQAGMAAAAEATGVSRRSLGRWLEEYHAGNLADKELEELVGQLVQEYRQEAREAMARAVSNGAQLIATAIQHWMEKADQLTPGNLRDLALATAIMQDKLLLLEGKPSSLSAHMSLHRTERFSTPFADEIRREGGDGQ